MTLAVDSVVLYHLMALTRDESASMQARDVQPSRDALRRFKQDHASAYAELDKQCESLTDQENFVGDFETIDSKI